MTVPAMFPAARMTLWADRRRFMEDGVASFPAEPTGSVNPILYDPDFAPTLSVAWCRARLRSLSTTDRSDFGAV